MHPVDDIPEARRQFAPRRSRFPWRWGWLGLLAVVMVGAVLWWGSPSAPPVVPEPMATPTPVETPQSLFGHLPYDEANPADLQALTADGQVKLHRDAAQAFLEMQEAARADGVMLVPLSGFRSRQLQHELFFGVKAQRGQRAAERALVSAPPGFSEHHTGYAIDIGDARRPDTHIRVSFAETEGFAWLEQRAAEFHFELSFPRNNGQGISFEPWHWRFVGSPTSLELFYRARTRFQSTEVAPAR